MSSHLRYKFPGLDITTATLENEAPIQYKCEVQSRPFMDGFYLITPPCVRYCKPTGITGKKSKDMMEGHHLTYSSVIYTRLKKKNSTDPDSINNRVQNILYHDKSKYDQKVANMVSDYININRALMKMLNGNGISDIEIYDKLNGELQGKIQSTNHNGETRQIEDLIRGRITINSIIELSMVNAKASLIVTIYLERHLISQNAQ